MYKNKIIYLLFLTVTNVSLQQHGGDDCVLSNNNPGKCLKLQECPAAIDEMKSARWPVLCRFSGHDPVVCCEPVVSKSEEMCKRYGKQVESLPVPVEEDTIGTEFPHMAVLGAGRKENIQWRCGGSLISDRFVLTSAYCTLKIHDDGVKFVRLGDIKLDGSSKNIQNFEIKRVIRYPDFKYPFPMYHNIALVELDKSVEFTAYIKPACLYQKMLDPEALLIDMLLTTTGWGFNLRSPPFILQKFTLQLYNNSECDRAYRDYQPRPYIPNGIMEDRQVCAGSKDEKNDPCQGESGGPLQIYMANRGLHGIVGTNSFGKGCGTPGIPKVYTRVSYYIPWIESVVWP